MSHIEIDRRVSKAAYAGKERRVPSKPALKVVGAPYGGPERRSMTDAGVSPTGVERRHAAPVGAESDAFRRHQELLAQQQAKPEPPVSPDPFPKSQGWF